MARVIWTPKALDKLELIDGYIHQFDPAAARRFARRLVAAGDSLQHFPSRGRPTEDGLRELVVVPPYIIRYVVQDDTVLIVNIRHGRQSDEA